MSESWGWSWHRTLLVFAGAQCCELGGAMRVRSDTSYVANCMNCPDIRPWSCRSRPPSLFTRGVFTDIDRGSGRSEDLDLTDLEFPLTSAVEVTDLRISTAQHHSTSQARKMAGDVTTLRTAIRVLACVVATLRTVYECWRSILQQPGLLPDTCLDHVSLILGTDTLPCVLRSLADHFAKSGSLTTRADGQSWKLDLRAGYKVFFGE